LINTILSENSSVLDIASNDGTLLSYFKKQNHKVLGIEPSESAFTLAMQKGIPTVNDFFNEDTSLRLLTDYGKFDLITATNIITHVKEPLQFLKSCKRILKEKGSIVVEFYYFESIISNLAFDQIYHEHISYFNMTTFVKLLNEAGLESYHAELATSQGGSLRVFISLPGKHRIDDSTINILSAEGSFDQIKERYKKFATLAKERSKQIYEILDLKRKEGKLIAGYGASAKAAVITNFLNIDASVVKAIADLSTTKQGKYLPGTAIPIVSPQDLINLSPDIIIIFSWNIVDEIVKQLEVVFKKDLSILTFMPKIAEIKVYKGDAR
ncbi:MAG: class I SAM-dependent methyltransferase, partial [Thermoplasmatales archaeon]